MLKHPRLCSLLLVVLAAGCHGARDDFTDAQYHGEDALSGSQEHLARAVRMVEHAEDFQEHLAVSHVLIQLGQWIHDQPPVDDWTADPMAATLPATYAKFAEGRLLAHMGFGPHDFLVLREAIWMRNISRWQVAQKSARRSKLQDEIDSLEDEIQRLESRSDPAVEEAALDVRRQRLDALRRSLDPPWLADLRRAEGEDAYEDVTTAMRLFDWTMRNVQLKPTHWDARLPEEASANQAKNSDSAALPIPPPGAEMPPWRAALLGRGDAALRAAIFIQLARQQKIDVVILGLKRGSGEEPRPWAAAAVVGEQLYLFEPELGLPFAGPGGEGICTWAQLRAEPSLLRQFDLDDESPYHVTESDLRRVVALIDATPASLSQRMMLVERNLAGQQRLSLTVAPSMLARKLRRLSLSEAAIWTAPYQGYEFEQLRAKNPEARAAYAQELSVYYSPFPLMKARMLHFRGELDNKDLNEYGAKHYYLQCRPSKREIDAVGENPYVKQRLAEMHPDRRDKYIAEMQQTARAAKSEATYWLGMLAVEQGQGGVAADYFDVRTLQADPDGPWSDGARYNLARIHEAGGQMDKAIALYEADDSPQRRGNLLRAKRLREEG